MLDWTILVSIFKKNFLMIVRYPFNLLSSVVAFYLIALMLFYGGKAIGGPAMETNQTLEGLIVGYIVWILCLVALSDLAAGISNEAQMGTLEQLFLTRRSFSVINLYNMLSNLFFELIIVALVFLSVTVSTGRYLHIDLLTLTPLILFTLGSAYGLGFIMAGLALVFKRIQSFFQIVQFVVVGFMVIPLDTFPLAKLLPVALGNRLIRQTMVQGLKLGQLPATDLALLAAVGAGYFLLGVLIFELLTRRSKQKGLLGQY